jgi:hypothetical protein
VVGIVLGGDGLQSLRLRACTSSKFLYVLYTFMDDIQSGN